MFENLFYLLTSYACSLNMQHVRIDSAYWINLHKMYADFILCDYYFMQHLWE